MASGTIYLDYSKSSGSYIRGRLVWSSDSTASSNTTDEVTVQVYVRKGHHSSTLTEPTTGQWAWKVAVNGKQYSGSVRKSVLESWVLLTTVKHTTAITHNDDGSKSITIKGEISAPSGTSFAGHVSDGSSTCTLDKIARESTLVATAANIGEVSTITVTRKAKAYTHSIQYKFGSLTGYLNADGSVSTSEKKLSDLSIGFTIPASFYAEIPSATQGTCTLTLRTYSGSTLIGSAKTATFKVTAAKTECAPAVSGTVIDTNDLTIAVTGDSSKLVRYMSNAQCTITAQANNSATITEKSIGGTVVTSNSRTINAIESTSIAFKAVDSRGYSATATIKPTIIKYVRLTANVTLTRDDPTSGNATLKITGDYYDGKFGSGGQSNTLTVKYRLKKSSGSYSSYVTVAVSPKDNAYAVSVSLSGLDYESSYTAQVVVADALDSVSKTSSVQPGIPVFDWGESDFAVHVMMLLQAGLTANTVSYIGAAEDSTEAEYETWLSAQLSEMPNKSVRLLTCTVPTLSNNSMCSILFKNSGTYAAVFSFSWTGSVYMKAYKAGVWSSTTTHTLT